MNTIASFSPPMWQERLTAWGVGPLFDVLRRAGGEARVVGGAVRDTLFGRPVGDVDLACTLTPERMVEALGQAGIKTVPTGIAHGTITAILNGQPHQITTLRCDIETDGRWAKVAYTDDWQADAARRDFTINAFYVDEQGAFFDYFGGQADLQSRLVRFIGDPAQRIGEDVLRILRAFRFLAQLDDAQGDVSPRLDPDGRAACAKLAHLLPTLSGERVHNEVIKLLSAPRPAWVWHEMMGHGIIGPILPEAIQVARLAKLESMTDAGTDPLCRLASLLSRPQEAQSVAQSLRLSRAHAARLRGVAELAPRMDDVRDETALRQVLYDHGADIVTGALMLWAVDGGARPVLPSFRQIIATWQRPVFPVTGRDLQALGVVPGPAMGKTLRRLEQWWRDQDFKPDAAACLAQAKVTIG